MDKKTLYITLLSLQLADIAITLLALQNPLNHELNPIPFPILFPLKIVVYPLLYTIVMYSDQVMSVFKEESNRDLVNYGVLLFCSLVLVNNLIKFMW